MSNCEVFDLFIRSGLIPEGHLPNIKDCFALVSVIVDQQYIFRVLERNKAGKHVESIVINCLRDLFKSASKHVLNTFKPIRIEIFINFSPCHDCSGNIVQFVRELKRSGLRVTTEFIFSHLYKIRRPWCVRNSRNEDLPSLDEHQRSLGGLLALKEEGIQVRPFEKYDWMRLLNHLNLPLCVYRVHVPKRDKEDKLMKLYCALLGLTDPQIHRNVGQSALPSFLEVYQRIVDASLASSLGLLGPQNSPWMFDTLRLQTNHVLSRCPSAQQVLRQGLSAVQAPGVRLTEVTGCSTSSASKMGGSHRPKGSKRTRRRTSRVTGQQN